MDKKHFGSHTGEVRKEWPFGVKVAASVFCIFCFGYILTEFIKNGLWFVALGILALAVCALIGGILVWLSTKVSAKKSFEVISEQDEK